MTDKEHAEAAWDYLTKTTDSYPKWKSRGFPMNTNWGKAKGELDAIGVVVEPPTPTPGDGTVIFNGDFDTGDESQWDVYIRNAADRFRVTTGDAGVSPRSGSHMARLECRQGEPTNWASSLSFTGALQSPLPIGVGQQYVDTYLGWSSWIPSSWPYADASMHSVFMEYHGNGGGSVLMSQAPFHWGILGNGANAGKFFVDLHTAKTGYSPLFQPAFEKLSDPGMANVWHDYVVRIKWSLGGDGRFTFWRDGVQKFDYTGPTAPLSGERIKLQACIYCKNAAPASKVMYHDEVKIGTTYDSVQPG